MTAEKTMNNVNKELHHSLEDLTSWVSGFIDLLEKEKKALKEKDIEAIESIAEKKIKALTESQPLFSSLENKEPESDYLNDLMHWVKANSANSPEAGNLLTSLDKLQNLNNVNGQLINRRMLQNKFLTNLLLGQSTDGETYKLNGQTDQGDSSCRIGTA